MIVGNAKGTGTARFTADLAAGQRHHQNPAPLSTGWRGLDLYTELPMIYIALAYLALALLIACLWAAIDATDGKHDHPGYYLARAIVWPVMLAMWFVEFIALNTNPSSKRRWKGKPDKAAPVPAAVPSATPVRRTPQVAATPQRPPTPATQPTEPNATGGRGGVKTS